MSDFNQLIRDLHKERELALSSFYGWYLYMQRNAPDLPYFQHQPAKHHRILMNIADQFLAGVFVNLLLAMAFGAGKSWLHSVLLPMYYQAINGGTKIVLNLAGAERLQLDFNRMRRRIARHPAYVALDPGLAVKSDEANVTGFAFEGGGSMRAFSCEGSILGQRADLQIGDDLVPSSAYVKSPDRMRDLNDKINDQWYSRHTVGNKQITVGTFWSREDPLSKMKQAMENGEAAGRVIVLPLDCTDPETDILGREMGERMFPELYEDDVNTRLQIKRMQKNEPHKFSTHYLCEPAIGDGQWIGDEENFILVETDPPPMKRRICIDVALGETTKNDYTVIAVVGIDAKRDYWIQELWRYRKGINYTIELLFSIKALYPDAVDVAIEDDPYSKSLMNSAREYARMHDKSPLAFNVVKIRGRQKEERASPLRNLFLDQRVKVVNGRHISELRHECLGFPGLQHDDTVDAIALGAALLPQTAGYSAPDTVQSIQKRQEESLAIDQTIMPDGTCVANTNEKGQLMFRVPVEKLFDDLIPSNKKGGVLSIARRRI